MSIIKLKASKSVSKPLKIKITSTVNEYATNNDPDTPPSTGWTSRAGIGPSLSEPYIWQRITYSYSDGTSKVNTPFISEIYSIPEISIPEFIGTLSELPTPSDYKDKDYFVLTQTMAGSDVYLAGTAWEISGDTYVQITDKQKLLTCLDSLKTYASEQDMTLQDFNSDTYSWFRTLIADSVIAGSIKASEGFFDTITISNATFQSGDIKLAQIETVAGKQADPDGATLPAFSKWDINEVYDIFPSEDSILNVSGNIGSFSLRKLVKLRNPSATMYPAQSGYSVSLPTPKGDYKFLVAMPDHSCKVSVNLSPVLIPGFDTYSTIRTYIVDANDNVLFESYGQMSYSFTLNVTAGQSLYVKYSKSSNSGNAGACSTTYQEVLFRDEGLNEKGFWGLESPSGTAWTFLSNPQLKPQSESFSVTYNGVTYTTPDLHYTLADEFAEYDYNNLLLNRTYKVDSIGVTYKGQARTVKFFKKISETTAVLTFEDGEVISINKGDYVYLQGTIKIAGTLSGVAMQGLYPSETNMYDIGSATDNKIWDNLYVNNVDSKTVVTEQVNSNKIYQGTPNVDQEELHHIHYSTNPPSDSQGSIGDLWVVYS